MAVIAAALWAPTMRFVSVSGVEKKRTEALMEEMEQTTLLLTSNQILMLVPIEVSQLSTSNSESAGATVCGWNGRGTVAGRLRNGCDAALLLSPFNGDPNENINRA